MDSVEDLQTQLNQLKAKAKVKITQLQSSLDACQAEKQQLEDSFSSRLKSREEELMETFQKSQDAERNQFKDLLEKERLNSKTMRDSDLSDYKTRLERLESEKSEFQDRLETLRQQLNGDSMKQNQQHLEEKKALLDELNLLKSQQQQGQQQQTESGENFERTILKYKGAIRQKSMELDRLREELQSSLQKLEAQTKQNEEHQSQFSKVKAELEQLQEEKVNWHNERETILGQTSNSWRLAYKDLFLHIINDESDPSSVAQDDVTLVTNDFSKVSSFISDLKNKKTALERDVKDINTEKTILAKTVRESRLKNEELVKQVKDLQDLQHQHSQVGSEQTATMKMMESKLLETQEELRLTTEAMESLNLEIEKIQSDRDQERQAWLQEKEALTTEKQNLSQTSAKLKIKLKETLGRLDELQARISELEAEAIVSKQSLQSQSQDLPIWMSKAAQFEAGNKQLNQQLQEQTLTLDATAAKVKKLESELKQSQVLVQDLEKNIEEMKRSLSASQEEGRQSRELQSLLMERELQIEKLNQQLQDRDQNIQQLQQGTEHIREEQLEIQKELERRVVHLEDQLDVMQKQADRAASVDATAQETLKRGFREQILILEHQLQDKQNLIDRLQGSESVYGGVGIESKEALKQRVVQLESELSNLQNQVSSAALSSNLLASQQQAEAITLELKKRVFQLEQSNLDLTRQVNDYKLFYNQQQNNHHQNGIQASPSTGSNTSRRLSSMFYQSLESGGVIENNISVNDILVTRGRSRLKRTFLNLFHYLDQLVVKATSSNSGIRVAALCTLVGLSIAVLVMATTGSCK